MSDLKISLNNVSVKYISYVSRFVSLKDFLISNVSKKNISKPKQTFAIENISVQIHEGEVVGIAGKNGAGKSTFLKLISKILVPTLGKIAIYGNISPLLAIGAGFHPELSGFENIYLYSAILGNSISETRQLLDEIIDFSELAIEKLEMPLRTYSAGMSARLAFSIAMIKRPEILLIDEVLAVGDIRFQQKCLTRIKNYRDSGSTILIVSHNPQVIRDYCTRALWIEKGHLKMDGLPNVVMDEYQNFMA